MKLLAAMSAFLFALWSASLLVDIFRGGTTIMLILGEVGIAISFTCLIYGCLSVLERKDKE